jgi:hypothetical protein
LTVITSSSRARTGDETQFFGEGPRLVSGDLRPAVQFSRSGRGAIHRGLRWTVSQNSAVLVRRRPKATGIVSARPDSVDIPRTHAAYARAGT